MRSAWDTLMSNWVLVLAGGMLMVLIAAAQPDPDEDDPEGEDHPDDPDQRRDFDIADELGAL